MLLVWWVQLSCFRTSNDNIISFSCLNWITIKHCGALKLLPLDVGICSFETQCRRDFTDKKLRITNNTTYTPLVSSMVMGKVIQRYSSTMLSNIWRHYSYYNLFIMCQSYSIMNTSKYHIHSHVDCTWLTIKDKPGNDETNHNNQEQRTFHEDTDYSGKKTIQLFYLFNWCLEWICKTQFKRQITQRNMIY